MEITVYRHQDSAPFHIDLVLDAGDFNQAIKNSHEIEERVRLIQADGSCYLELVGKIAPKADVIRELAEKLGSAKDAAELLGVERFYQREFEKLVTAGDFEAAARYAGRSFIQQKKFKARRDSKPATIRSKMEIPLEAMSADAREKLDVITDEKLNQIQYNAKSKRAEYRNYVMRLIDHNGDVFETENADQIGALRERIAGYEASLKEAKQAIREMKNQQVARFATNDGFLSPSNCPIAPTVREEMAEKASRKEFFESGMFGL